MINIWVKVFLAHHIKPDDHVRVLGSFEAGVDLGLSVVSSQDLESASDNLHLEKWELGLDHFLDSFEDGELPLEGEGTSFIEDAAEDVLPLYNGDSLLDHVLAHSVQYHFEELGVVVQLEGQRKLGLEVLPDFVVLLGAHAFLSE